MTEIVIENTIETVIELEGGPILTTAISNENLMVIDVPADPIIVDLNSGPVGEVGSHIFTGDAPTELDGRVYDIFIVTEPNGSPTLGDTYQKTQAGWIISGNIRGASGGINSVNGYTGPSVTLTKSDLVLGNVDNTSDANKPISTATQTALDDIDDLILLKADTDEVVKLTTAQTIADVKTFSSAPVVPADSWTIDRTSGLQTALDGKVTLTTLQIITARKAIHVDDAGDTYSSASLEVRNDTGSPRLAFHKSGVRAGQIRMMDSGIFEFLDQAGTAAVGIVTSSVSATTVGGTTITASTGFSGPGGSITALNGTNISTGTVADARLSSNVVLLTGSQTITGAKTFSGAVIVPTPTASNHAATKGYIDAIVDAAPGTLDTLNELAAALGDDANFSTTITNSLATKVSLTANETIAGNKSFSNVVSIGNTNNLRIGTSTTPRNVLMADASGYATWGNPMLLATAKAETDNASTYSQVGTYIQDSAGGGGWPDGFGVILTAFHSVERAWQISYGKGNNQLKVRSAIGTGTNGWNAWQTIANDAMVIHLAGTETITGAKSFSSIIAANAGVAATTLSASGTATIASSIELGRVDGTGNTPFIDFHAGATAVDYDARILATAGTGSTGQGTLTYTAATHTFVGIIGGNGSLLTTLNGSNVSSGTIAQARLVQNVVQVVHGATAGTARPTGATFVHWVGTVAPTNATSNDIWWNA